MRQVVAVMASVATFIVMAAAASTPAQAEWTDCKVKCLKSYSSCAKPCSGAMMSTTEALACMRVCMTDNDKCTEGCNAKPKPKP